MTVNANRANCRCSDTHVIGCTVVFTQLELTKTTIDVEVLFVNLVTLGLAFKLDNRTNFNAVIKSGRTFEVHFGVGLESIRTTASSRTVFVREAGPR